MTTDLVLFTGGAVFDGQRYRGQQDVLVSGGKVAEVVPPGVVSTSMVGEVVDLDGGLISPGFTDAHAHPVQGGLERVRCDLSALGEEHGPEDYLQLIGAYVEANPVGWILGGGWSMASFPGGTPLATDLDGVTGERPAFLPNRDHHGAWVNSAALRVAGIHAGTPDPADGRIERDERGNPTGTLHEGAMDLITPHLPATTADELDLALSAAQEYLLSVGVIGWQDAIVGDYAGFDDAAPVYLRAIAAGSLVVDVVGALWWQRDRGVEQVADLIERRAYADAAGSGRFRATSVKIMADGVAENGSAAMLEPYLDGCGHASHNSGHAFVAPEALRAAVAALDDVGFQVHVHAIGDRAVREALNAFEATNPELRHHIAHLQVINPADLPRFAGLGVAANLQAYWACNDSQMTELTVPSLGVLRAGWQYPFADILRHGARLVMGSDWPVSTPDPLQAMHVAVNRKTYGQSGRAVEPLGPEQALSLEAAFAAYTSGSAWINHRDCRDGAGVLTPGAAADLVVLNVDPFRHDVAEIGATKVNSTWIAGRKVYEQ